jgi:hypothetical protein
MYLTGTFYKKEMRIELLCTYSVHNFPNVLLGKCFLYRNGEKVSLRYVLHIFCTDNVLTKLLQ